LAQAGGQQQGLPFTQLGPTYFRGVSFVMGQCAASLNKRDEETAVSFGRGGNIFPNYQVTCDGQSFVFLGQTHLPFAGPGINLSPYDARHFRVGFFNPGEMLPGSWPFNEIARNAAQNTPENDDGAFETELEAKYEGIMPPVRPGDPDPANAIRRMQTARRAQRDKWFRDRLLLKQGEPNHCAVCDMGIRGALQGAHVVGVGDGGKDIVSNGLVLCGTHHLIFDAHLFGITPKTHNVTARPGGPTLGAMQITRAVICEAVSENALDIRWPKFQASK
jgi:hypothetical protein